MFGCVFSLFLSLFDFRCARMVWLQSPFCSTSLSFSPSFDFCSTRCCLSVFRRDSPQIKYKIHIFIFFSSKIQSMCLWIFLSQIKCTQIQRLKKKKRKERAQTHRGKSVYILYIKFIQTGLCTHLLHDGILPPFIISNDMPLSWAMRRPNQQHQQQP